MIRIYLALQEFDDGRVMFRRWSPDSETIPGGHFQKQTLQAFQWLMEQSWNFPDFPQWPHEFTHEDVEKVAPFEVLA